MIDIADYAGPIFNIEVVDHHRFVVNWGNSLEEMIEHGYRCVVMIRIYGEEDRLLKKKYLVNGDRYLCEVEPNMAYRVTTTFYLDPNNYGRESDPVQVELDDEPAYTTELFKYCNSGDAKVLHNILKHKQHVLDGVDRCDLSPLMISCSRGFREVAKVLLKHGATVDFQNSTGRTALMLSTFYGQISVMELLLERKANPNLTDVNGHSSLFFAIDGEHEAAVKLLLRYNVDVNLVATSTGATPIIRIASMCTNGNTELARLLWRNRADVNAADKEGLTALMHCAFHRPHADLAKFLVKEASCERNKKSKKGVTADEIAHAFNNYNYKKALAD